MNDLTELADLKAIEVEATNVQVYNQIRQAISRGAFSPGDGLSTRKIADALRVSQTPVREAFQRLVAERGLEKRANRTIGIPILSVQSFNEITDIRVELEGFATERAAEAVDSILLAQVHDLTAKMENLSIPNQVEEYLKLNRDFHFLVYGASKSQTLVRLIDQLWLQVGPVLNWSARNLTNTKRSNIHHANICKAMSQSDPKAARHSLEQDILEAAIEVRDAIQSFNSTN